METKSKFEGLVDQLRANAIINNTGQPAMLPGCLDADLHFGVEYAALGYGDVDTDLDNGNFYEHAMLRGFPHVDGSYTLWEREDGGVTVDMRVHNQNELREVLAPLVEDLKEAKLERIAIEKIGELGPTNLYLDLLKGEDKFDIQDGRLVMLEEAEESEVVVANISEEFCERVAMALRRNGLAISGVFDESMVKDWALDVLGFEGCVSERYGYERLYLNVSQCLDHLQRAFIEMEDDVFAKRIVLEVLRDFSAAVMDSAVGLQDTLIMLEPGMFAMKQNEAHWVDADGGNERNPETHPELYEKIRTLAYCTARAAIQDCIQGNYMMLSAGFKEVIPAFMNGKFKGAIWEREE